MTMMMESPCPVLSIPKRK